VSFAREDSPFPATSVPLIVADWAVRLSDGRRLTNLARFLCVGDQVHRVGRDGSIDASLTTLTEGMAAHFGLVEVHLERDAKLRCQRWKVVYFAPSKEGRTFATVDVADGDGGTTTIDRRVSLSHPTCVTDERLFGPLPPAGSRVGAFAFLVVAPVSVILDAALWLSGIGMIVELPLGMEEQDLVIMGWSN
jgi:hypothetical protein